MRILFLESVHNLGGSVRSTLELAKRLKNNGVTVCIVDFWGFNSDFIRFCVENNLTLHVLDPKNAPILLSNGGVIRRYLKKTLYIISQIKYTRDISVIIDNYRPDIVCVNNSKALFSLKKSGNYKIAYFVRGWFLPKSVSLFEKWLLRRKVDVFLCVSQATRQMVYATGFAKLEDIFVVHGAIDSDRISQSGFLNPGIVCKTFRIFHCGTFINGKGHFLALNILRMLKTKGIDCVLVMAGLLPDSEVSASFYAEVISFIKNNDLSENVEIYTNSNEIKALLMSSHVLIHPSLSEGLPRVILEAMSLGIPVIANPVGGVIDLIIDGYTGFKTTHNDIDDYVNILSILMTDRNLYNFVSENAFNLIKTVYTAENQLNSFKSFLSKLVQHRE